MTPSPDIERHVRYYLDRDIPVLFLYDNENPDGTPVSEHHPALIAWAMHVVKTAEAGQYPPAEMAAARHIATRTEQHQQRIAEAERIRERLRIIATDKEQQ